MAYTDPPTPFQKKICWAGLTSLAALVTIGAIAIAGYAVISFCGYLKPVLTPVAIAAVLAYLLTPVVSTICRWKIPRTWAVIVVFILFSGGVALIALTVAPALEHQGSIFASRLPAYSQSISTLAKSSASELQRLATLKASSVHHNSPLEDVWYRTGHPGTRMGAG